MSAVQSAVSPVEVPTIGRRIRRGMFIAMLIGLVFYGSVLFYFDADALAENCTKLTFNQALVLLGVSSINFVFRYLRWEYYLRRLRLTVARLESVLIFLGGFAMSLSPGKFGEVLKSVMLRESVDAPMARTAPIVLAERVTDLAGLVLLGGIGLGFRSEAWWVAGVFVAGVVLLGAIVGSRRIGTRVVELLPLPGRAHRFRGKLLEMLEALREMVTPGAYVYGTFLSVLAWGAHGWTLMMTASAFPEVDLSMAASQFAYSAPLIAGTLAMLPGGVGLTEASMAGVIMETGGAGATPAVAASITIIVRAVTFWFAIAVGMLALGVWQWRQRSVRAIANFGPRG